jgi:hypothetical protein
MPLSATQHNATQHNELICDTQHKRHSAQQFRVLLCRVSIINMLSVAFFIVILSVIMLNVDMLNVIMLNVIMLNVIMLNVVMLSFIMLNVIMLSVVSPKFLVQKYDFFLVAAIFGITTFIRMTLSIVYLVATLQKQH